jgi:hypothetical protein
MNPLDVSAKPMFAEYGLYFRGKNFAFVCDNPLIVTITDTGSAHGDKIALLAVPRDQAGLSDIGRQAQRPRVAAASRRSDVERRTAPQARRR